MNPEKMVKELMTAIGGLAETLWAFKNELSNKSFTQEESLYLIGEFMKAMLPGSGRKY